MVDGKVRIQIESNAPKATAEMKGFDNALKDTKKDGGQLVQGNNALQGSMNKLAGAVKGLVGAYIGLQGIKAVTGYVSESIEAFRTQERAVISMETALMNAGVYTQQFSSHLQELASEIQQTSNYGDEMIEKAVGLGQSFAGQTRLTDDLIRATVDFAAAMDMDLDSAFTLVGKSIGTSTNALGRYGVELKKGMTDSQKMQAIVEQLGARYDGQAKNMANASVQLKNAMGDLSEAIGGVFAPALQLAQEQLTKAAEAATYFINQLRLSGTAVKDLKTVQDAQDKLRQIWVQQEKLQKKIATSHAAEKRYNEQKLQDYNKQEQAILEQIELLQKQDEERAKLSKNTGFKMKDGATIPTVTSAKSVTHIKTAYEQLQESVEKARMSVLNMATIYGESSTQVQQAMTVYRDASQKLANVNDVLKEQAEQAGPYEQLNQRLQDLRQSLLDLGASGQIGTEQFQQIKEQYLQTAQELKNINDALTEEMGNGWEKFGQDVGGTIKSSLVSSLKQGANAWETFGNIAVAIQNKIIDKIMEEITWTQVLNTLKTVGKAVGGFLGLPFAKGGAFQNGVQKFATGGVVNKPTTFAMAGGKTGLMGEAGAEAIMPLKRTSSGDLGVQATQPNINIYNQSGAQIETVTRPDGDIDLFIKRVNSALSNERTQQGFSNALKRNDTRGLQAS